MQSWADFLNELAENIESVGNVTNTLINETTGVQRNIISQNYALQDMYYQRLLGIYQNLADLVDQGATNFEMSGSGGHGFYRIVSGGDLYLVTIQSGNSADSVLATSQHFTIHAKMFRKIDPDFSIPVTPTYTNTTSSVYVGVAGDETGYTYTIRMYDSTGYLNPYQADVGGAGLYLSVNVSKSTSDGSIPVISQGRTLSSSYYVGGLATSDLLTTDNVDIENPWDYYNNILKPQLDENLQDSTLPDDQKNTLYVFPNGYEPPAPTGEGIDDKEKGTGDNLPNTAIKLIGADGFVTYYLLSHSNLLDLQSAIGAVATTFWQAIGTATDYRFSNILNYIVSLKWYPLDILNGNDSIYPDTATSDIQFAFAAESKLTLTSGLYRLATCTRVYDMGTVTVPYKLATETFLDKDPYTTVNVWLPFCGLYPVKSDFVVGHTIKFRYIVDLVTGMCTVLVSNERDTVLNVTGKIGTDFTVAGNDVITQSERLSSSYINGAVSAISGGISLAGNIATGNVLGGITSGANLLGNIAASSIDIASSKRAVPQTVSSGSGFGSAYASDTPCVIVNPPAIKIPDGYGHAQGYISNVTTRLSSLAGKGFTVCINPDLTGIVATSRERDMIQQLLTTGIYL